MRAPAHAGADAGRAGSGYRGRHVIPGTLTACKVISAVRSVMEIIVIVVVIDLVFGMYVVPSESMEPTMRPGECFVGERVRPFLGDLHRGDVIVFADEDGWMDHTAHEGQRLVKRLVGLPGDRVSSKDGVHVKVNGKTVDEAGWVSAPSPMIPFDVVVPSGRLWVMGDNRSDSADSRLHMDRHDGTISARSVEAVIIIKVAPRPGVIGGHRSSYDG